MLNYGVRICVSRLNENRTMTKSERTYTSENLDTAQAIAELMRVIEALNAAPVTQIGFNDVEVSSFYRRSF